MIITRWPSHRHLFVLNRTVKEKFTSIRLFLDPHTDGRGWHAMSWPAHQQCYSTSSHAQSIIHTVTIREHFGDENIARTLQRAFGSTSWTMEVLYFFKILIFLEPRKSLCTEIVWVTASGWVSNSRINKQAPSLAAVPNSIMYLFLSSLPHSFFL